MKTVKVIFIFNLILTVLFSLVLLSTFAISKLNYERLGYIESDLSVATYLVFIVPYLITIVLIYLFYRFGADKYSLSALPLSFAFFPFILYFLMSGARYFVEIIPGTDAWEIWAAIVAIYYAWPFAVLTLIGSHIVKRIKEA